MAVAYLGWLQASNAVQIVAASEALLAENLRVQRALYEQVGLLYRDRLGDNANAIRCRN